MHVTKTVSSDPPTAGTFTDAVELEPARNSYLNVTIYGASAFVMTVTLQRKFSDMGVWLDVTEYTANSENGFSDFERGVLYRLGVKDTGWTSGSAIVRLGT